MVYYLEYVSNMAFPRVCPLCGPKLSVCCMVMSAWAIIFLGVLGAFFYAQSAMLFEDLGYEQKPKQGGDWERDHLHKISEKYASVARNCWIATGAYAVTLIVAFWQNKWQSRMTLS